MKVIARVPQMVLGFALAYAGVGHLTTSRTEFQAQVPSVFADYADFVVLASGVVEIALGIGYCIVEVQRSDRLVGSCILCCNLLGKYLAVCKWRRCIWFRYRYKALGAVVLPAVVGYVGVAKYRGVECVA